MVLLATMKLLIVESPSKAKTIEKYLEGAYTVRASVGHIRDLPKSSSKAIDIEKGFVPHYEISKGKEHIVKDLRTLAQKADSIVLATDPDREGEAIAWHIEEILKDDKKVKAPIARVAFNEITKEAVTEALNHPREIDTDLRLAQEARRVLDRLVGYDLSKVIWQKVRYGLSAGRVQSPALRILVEREREIKSFIPEKYWVLKAIFELEGKKELELICVEEPRDYKEVERILSVGNKESWKIRDVKENEQKRSPKAPFTTSTLQQAANSRLGFSPSKTMQVAQKLYEAGQISYMRTDSTTLSQIAIRSIAQIVENKYGKNYLEVRAYKTKSKNAQEAHEAIRPTHFEKVSAGNNDDQKKLYNLIWSRTVASQMSDARFLKTRITANVSDNSIPDFATTGSLILFDGWLKADPMAASDDIRLPELKIDQALTLKEITETEKQTEPPNRYSEAGLVKELEARGIGRPSTYASIIKTIEARGYVEKLGRSLKPTDTGEVVSTFLEQNFMNYISDNFTAQMEDLLDEIASGEASYLKTLKDFYGPFLKEIKAKEKLDKATTLEKADAKFKCPKCGSGMLVKLGRAGKFLSCDRYPDCDGALTLEGLEIKPDEPIGRDSKTQLPIFVKIGRFGPYVQLGKQAPKKTKSKTSTKGRSLSEAVSSSLEREPNVSDFVSKPKMASIPKEVDPTSVTVEMAMHYLALPRTLGTHPEDGKDVIANIGRFGPYVGHERNFRSIKVPLDPYTITLEQALELLAQEKKKRGFQRKKK